MGFCDGGTADVGAESGFEGALAVGATEDLDVVVAFAEFVDEDEDAALGGEAEVGGEVVEGDAVGLHGQGAQEFEGEVDVGMGGEFKHEG